MPRSRNSRSASPHKSVSAENIVEIERKKAVQNVTDIFYETVDTDVIQLVLQECSWKEEDAVEKLLMIAESREEQRRYKSKLHRIAEGVFGSLRSEDYGSSSVVTAASSLSPSEKVIRRPSKQAATSDKTVTNATRLKNVGASEHLVAKGLAPTFYLSGAQGNHGNGNSAVDEIEMDLHFPQLPTKSSETNLSSTSSSVSSQKSHSELAKTPSSSKTALLSQAQSAFNQQFDDAEGTQRWEQYKQKLSEHYLNSLTKDKGGAPSKGQSSAVSPKQSASISDDPAILQVELESPRSDKVIQKEIERPRPSSRSFPVRLLSRSPDTVEGQNVPTKSEKDPGNLDSADLDETVLKCIYEVQGDLLDDKELERSSLSQNAERKNSSTPTNLGQAVTSVSKPVAQLSNEAMTLPTIGLSVDAQEFVPRPKPAVSKVAVTVSPEITTSSPQPASKVTKSSSIEIKSGVKNAQLNSSPGPVGSPLTVSPSLSPGISPPSTLMSSPVANLTGSPMFITPKWPQVLHTINHPPPMPPTVLASTTSRFVSPNPAHHLSPPGYRFPPGGTLPFSSRMLYTVAPPPPLFRMAGMPRYVQQPNVPMGEHLEDRAAVATGQPIMATSESSRLMSMSGLTTVKLISQTYIEQKVERIHTLQKSGLKVLVIVRGLPGSGKTTLARALQLNGVVLSTDDYFMKGNIYEYYPDKLTEAHQWNRERTKEAMKMGKSPIIIDNTNTQVWEFKPYTSLALTYTYHIELMEPGTPWKFKASELARRTLHKVPQDQIERMSNRYEHNITVERLIRKRKADTKSNENDGTEDIDESTIKHNENTASADENTTHTSQFTENRSAKDLRLLNFNKSDDLRKQKSVESDSDSICSYHSGSLSNQSSRNASPKPLRPSLKTPGALQKIEKLKASASTKPVAIKPTVKKVKRRAIKQMEAKLSSETVQIVNDMVSEHVGDRILSVNNVGQLEEEMKALLNIYPVIESEIPAAEELIGLFLYDVVNQSADIPEDADNVEEETSDKELTKDIYSDGILLEIPSNNIKENISKSKEILEEVCTDSVTKENPENSKQLGATSDDLKKKKQENDLLKNVLYNECKPEESDTQLPVLDRSKTDRSFPSWTAIANTTNAQRVNMEDDKKIKSDTDVFGCIDSVDEEVPDSDGTVSHNFELQYWGKEFEHSSNNITSEDIQNCWNDNLHGALEDSLSESSQAEDINIEKIKPQRKKRNRSTDILPDTNATQPNISIKSNNLDDNTEETHMVHESNEVFGVENEKMQHDDSTRINADKELGENIAGVGSLNETETGIEESKKTKMESKLESSQESLEDDNNETAGNLQVSDNNVQDSAVVDSLCSNIDICRSQSQDSNHETSYLNSSLQLLKESYVDDESAIHHSENDNKDICSNIDLKNSAETEIDGTNVNSDTEIKSSGDIRDNSRNAFDEKSSESLTYKQKETEKVLESKSSEMLGVFEADTVNIMEDQSTESFTPSEGSEIDVSARLGSDFEVTPQTSPQKSLTPLTTQRNKKPPRRKMAANLKGPFLNYEDREKFKTSAWNSFPLHAAEKQVLSPVSSTSNLLNGKDLSNAETMTDSEYFNLLERLNQGEFVDSSINYLIGNPKRLVNGHIVNTELKSSSSTSSLNEVHTSEKSTSTDDFVPLTDTESVEFLRTCFPAVPPGELECVLENCDNNTEWAINLLLDWKYSLNLTEDEKKKFAEGIAELKRASPKNDETCSVEKDSGPSSLLDMCFSLVEKEKIASREEIEKQLIQTGKERLDRIEDDNITKIRLHRSTSLNESSTDHGRVSPQRKQPSVFRSVSLPAQIDNSVTHFQESQFANNTCTEKEDIIDENDGIDHENRLMEKADSDGICGPDLINDSENEVTVGHNNVDNVDVISNHAEIEVEDLYVKPAMSMNVDTEVIGQLEDMFGPLGNRNDIKEGLSVPIDHKTAWLMYQCVKKSVVLKRSQLQKEQQQLVKDEEFARQLQEQENAYMKPGTRDTRNLREEIGSRTRRTIPLVGLSVLGTFPQHKEPVAWNRGNQSLAEIMQEEQRIQDSQEDFRRLVQNEGGHVNMATCLKRQKLYGRFPKLDRKLLDETLQVYCFNLSETMAAISSWLEESNTSTSVTDSQDHKLLEDTKERSMQEMLDAHIYHSVVSKDYQDEAEPVYEDYRGEASLHFRLRQECFQKAKEAYRRGLKQVATFYSQQGHQHTQKIKEANMRASEQILTERNTDLERNMTLDLHGLHVDEAIAALNRIIPQKEKERCKKLTVITGRGSHSRGGVAKLRPSIIGYLKANKYNYTEVQLGVFSVPLKYRSPDR